MSSPRSKVPLRVLLLNEFFYPDNQGGTATATSNIARRLVDDHGFDVDVITGQYGYRDPDQRFAPSDEWSGIRIYRTGNPNWGRDRPAKRFLGNIGFAIQIAWKALFLPKPNVVLITTAPMTLPISARILKTLRRVPFVYIVYDLDPDRTVALKVKGEDARSVRLLRGWQSRWLRSADRVIVIGRCMRERIVRNYNVDSDRVDVVPVGADPNVIVPMKRDTAFRKKNGIEGFVVLYAGNFGQYHDFDTLLGAAEKLRDSHAHIRFVLVGGGKKRSYVADEVARRSLSNVVMHDFVPEEELSDLLASSDLSVVTLEPGMEGICVPSKFYACLASGRPVLALMGAEGEVARVVEETGTGVRVAIGDVDGLVAQLIQMAKGDADSESKRERIGNEARSLFERMYSMEIVASQIGDSLKAAAVPVESRNTEVNRG